MRRDGDFDEMRVLEMAISAEIVDDRDLSAGGGGGGGLLWGC